MEYGTSLALTRWLAGALLEKGCGDATSKLGALLLISSMGIPQGSPLLLVLFNVFTKGLADLNQNGPCKIPTLAVDGFIYKTSRDSQETAEAVQQQLDSAYQWCQDAGSLISPDKRHKHCGALLTTEQ